MRPRLPYDRAIRYFFHRLDGGFDTDTEGTECIDREAARREAILYAAGTMRDNPEYVWSGGELRIEVTDERGSLVTTVVILSIDAIDLAEIFKASRDKDTGR